jgi:hypothetical protein
MKCPQVKEIKMSENQKKILQMLAEGKISVDEAQRLLMLIDAEGSKGSIGDTTGTGEKTLPRYMHVIVEPKPGAHDGDNQKFHKHKVNVKIPFGLIRAGIKLATLIPSDTADQVDRAFKEKGLHFDIRHLKEGELEEMVMALRDSEIYVDSDNETVRLYAE